MTFYDLEVDGHPSYFADGVLVHNCARATVDAQSALLKMLEDTPAHVYFILATTEPNRLLPAIRTRATEIKTRLLKRAEMSGLLCDISEREGFSLHETVREKLIVSAEGSPRKALVLLNQILLLDGKEEQLAAISAGEGSPMVLDLCRLLMQGKSWASVAKLLKELDEDPESIRRAILGYFKAVLLGGNARGYSVIVAFERPFYDTGMPGLVAACWDAMSGR